MDTRGRFAVAIAVGVTLVGALAWAASAAYHPLRPRILCQLPLGTGETAVYFGYTNDTEHDVVLANGEDNRVSSWARVTALPTVFARGNSGRFPDAAFVATFAPADVPENDTLSWHLGTRIARVTIDTPRCPIAPLSTPPDDIVWVKPRPVEALVPEPIPVAALGPQPPVAPPERPEKTPPERPDKPPEPVKPRVPRQAKTPEPDSGSGSKTPIAAPGDGPDGGPAIAGPGTGSAPQNGSGQGAGEASAPGTVKAPDRPATKSEMSPEAWAGAVGALVQRGLRYPRDAEDDGVEGIAVVRIDVGADGAITQATLRTSAGDPRLDQAALARVKALGRVPSPPGGARQIDVPIRFRIP